MSLLKLKSIFSPAGVKELSQKELHLDNNGQHLVEHTKFDDGVKPNTKQYTKNNPSILSSFTTNLDYTQYDSIARTYPTGAPITISLEKRGGKNNPILDSLLRGRVYTPIRFSQDIINRNQFVLPDTFPFTTPHPFLDETFDPRANTPKEGTLYFNTNRTLGTLQYGDGGFRQNTTFNSKITDFSTAAGNNDTPFTPLSQLGVSFYNGEGSDKNLSWETLYNANHSPKDNPTWEAGKLTAINYGVNVNRDKLNIRSAINNTQSGGNLLNLSRDPFLGLQSRGEPYIVSDIPQSTTPKAFTGGRITNVGSREFATVRGITDIVRLTNFLSSPAGIGFIAAQNFLGGNSKSVFIDRNEKGIPIGLKQSRQRFSPSYNPASALIQQLRIGGTSPISLTRKNKPALPTPSNMGIDIFGGGEDEYKGQFADGSTISDTFTNAGTSSNSTAGFFSALGAVVGGSGLETPAKRYYGDGDKMTLAEMIEGVELDPSGRYTTPLTVDGTPNRDYFPLELNIDSERDGMPFYFKDMRDDKYIFFRAYIEGLTENIAPSYTSTNYIGRSEPVYIYERAEREINFTLKLIAQSRLELINIYQKMEKLTSMCYPEYMNDDYGNRMKPPLSKFRYGELFGKTNKEVMGYIKSLSYSVENSSTYETEVSKRVPKHINLTLGFQVIHDEAPNMNMSQKFYGINQNE